MKLFQFKLRNIRKVFNSEIAVYDALPKTIGQGKIKKIAILVENEQMEQFDIRLQIQQLFNVSAETIDVLIFKPFVKNQVYESNEITEKDFAWNGSLKLNSLEEFVKNEYDLLINYGYEENFYWKVITLRSHSDFKIGFSSKEKRLYDLSVVDSNWNVETLNLEAEKYLKILKKI